MRDRLIELIGSKVCEAYSPTCDEWQPHSCEKCFANSCRIGDLADHLLANGVIVPPCKVGDTVYEIQPIRKRAQAYEITTIKYNGHYWWFTWILKDRKGIYGNVEGFSSHQIGKTVFLTKELAEKALAERSGE